MFVMSSRFEPWYPARTPGGRRRPPRRAGSRPRRRTRSGSGSRRAPARRRRGSAMLDVSLVTKSVPRADRTGQACWSIREEQHDQDQRATSSRADSSSPLKIVPPMSRLRPRSAASTRRAGGRVDDASVDISSSSCTRRTNRSLTRLSENVMMNSSSPTKYERVERVDGSAPVVLTLVGSDRERRDRARHRLAGQQRVERCAGLARGARGDRHHHRLADRAGEPEDQPRPPRRRPPRGTPPCIVTVRRRRPIPYAASRSAAGTACIASSATVATKRDREDADADARRHDRERARGARSGSGRSPG